MFLWGITGVVAIGQKQMEKKNSTEINESVGTKVKQTGKDNFVHVTQSSDSAVSKQTTVIRDGQGNVIITERSSPSGVHQVEIKQKGQNNRAVVNQTGESGNRVQIRQGTKKDE